MLLVVDANTLFSALVASEGSTRSLFSSLRLEFISPEFIEKELDKYFPELVAKAKRPELDVRTALEILLAQIRILPYEEYEHCMKEANRVSPDPKDAEYFAVALAFDCPLWSNDKRLKKQSVVRVLSTSELLELRNSGHFFSLF